jgi:hypothetical protein
MGRVPALSASETGREMKKDLFTEPWMPVAMGIRGKEPGG